MVRIEYTCSKCGCEVVIHTDIPQDGRASKICERCKEE